MASGLERDVAVLATKSNKPSTQRQFQSGWKQFGNYLARNHFRHEDVKVATVANFMGIGRLSMITLRPVQCLIISMLVRSLLNLSLS